jgi:hypothetical protein
VAAVGDWVAGLGSKNAPCGDLSGRLVYAMCVDEVLTMSDYDRLAPTRWPHRIPNLDSLALQDRLGDCIYDFSSGVSIQRKGVHGKRNVQIDLDGLNVLVSRKFYYFGRQAIELPHYLLPICHQTQGHKSNSNAPYFEQFVEWVSKFGPTGMRGWPDFIVDWSAIDFCGGCTIRQIDNEADPSC